MYGVGDLHDHEDVAEREVRNSFEGCNPPKAFAALRPTLRNERERVGHPDCPRISTLH